MLRIYWCWLNISKWIRWNRNASVIWNCAGKWIFWREFCWPI